MISEKSSKKIYQVYEKYKEVYPGKIFLSQAHYENTEDRINNRAGTNPRMKEKSSHEHYFCYFPFEMATFTADGTMSACSDDFYLENNIGNIHNNSFIELFTGEKINALRKDLLNFNRSKFEACAKCDNYGISHLYDFPSFYKNLLPRH